VTIRHALLALVSEGPTYGLQLRQEFAARTGDEWSLNVGQVYTTLQRLERDGLIASEDVCDDERQKRFRITDNGAAELSAWLKTPSEVTAPPRDELVIKVLIASRVPGVDVHELLEVHRRHVKQLMQEWSRLLEDEGASDLSLALAVDAELFRLEAVIRWLDAADGRFARAASGLDDNARARSPVLRRRVVARR